MLSRKVRGRFSGGIPFGRRIIGWTGCVVYGFWFGVKIRCWLNSTFKRIDTSEDKKLGACGILIANCPGKLKYVWDFNICTRQFRLSELRNFAHHGVLRTMDC